MKLHCYITLFLFSFFNLLTAQNTYLFVGSYVEGDNGEGIHVYEFDNGLAKEIQTLDNLPNSGYLELTKNGKFLYCAHDFGATKEGKIGVYNFDPNKKELTFLQDFGVKGESPCHVAIAKNDSLVTVSNYRKSSVSVFHPYPNGKLRSNPKVFYYTGNSVVKGRQKASHMHSSNFSPDGKFIFSPDLGTDHIHALKIGKDYSVKRAKKSTVTTVKGAGPRHFTFHPNGNFGYAINELNGTVVSYSYKKGKLNPIDEDFSYSKKQKSYGSADIHISPDGKFLYTSNRWKDENTIAIFKIAIDGTLDLVGHQTTFGDHPRNFVIDPSGNFLLVANKNTNNVVVFKRDLNSGLLSKIESEIKVNQPTCLKFRVY